MQHIGRCGAEVRPSIHCHGINLSFSQAANITSDIVRQGASGLCSVTCPDEGITARVARQNCNGIGCCSTDVRSIIDLP
jgi:hypothetical protein